MGHPRTRCRGDQRALTVSYVRSGVLDQRILPPDMRVAGFGDAFLGVWNVNRKGRYPTRATRPLSGQGPGKQARAR